MGSWFTLAIPTAHEDDARRAVRAGLEIIAALHHFAPSPALAGEGRGEGRLQVRLGIHTGLVVVGEMGSGDRREQLALGDTPNVAARIQSLNQTTQDWYTSSPAVDSLPVRPERSAAKSKARKPSRSALFDFAASAATLRANGLCLLTLCRSVPKSCGLI
jgi:class 3 adenylate cyclase